MLTHVCFTSHHGASATARDTMRLYLMELSIEVIGSDGVNGLQSLYVCVCVYGFDSYIYTRRAQEDGRDTNNNQKRLTDGKNSSVRD